MFLPLAGAAGPGPRWRWRRLLGPVLFLPVPLLPLVAVGAVRAEDATLGAQLLPQDRLELEGRAQLHPEQGRHVGLGEQGEGAAVDVVVTEGLGERRRKQLVKHLKYVVGSP